MRLSQSHHVCVYRQVSPAWGAVQSGEKNEVQGGRPEGQTDFEFHRARQRSSTPSQGTQEHQSRKDHHLCQVQALESRWREKPEHLLQVKIGQRLREEATHVSVKL